MHLSQLMSQCAALLFIGVWHDGIFSSVQSVSCSVLSDSLRPHGPQHARPSCPSPTCGVYPNSSPLSQWCHPTISFSVIPFSFCPQSFTASGFLPMSHSLHQMAKVLEFRLQHQSFPMIFRIDFLGWTGWISLQSKGLSRIFSHTTVQKHQFFGIQLFYSPTLTSIDDYWKNHSLD